MCRRGFRVWISYISSRSRNNLIFRITERETIAHRDVRVHTYTGTSSASTFDKNLIFALRTICGRSHFTYKQASWHPGAAGAKIYELSFAITAYSQ